MAKRLLLLLAMLGGLLLSCSPAHAQTQDGFEFRFTADVAGAWHGSASAACSEAKALYLPSSYVLTKIQFEAWYLDGRWRCHFHDPNSPAQTWAVFLEHRPKPACPTSEVSQASVFNCYMLKGVDVTCGSQGTHSSTPTPPSACDGSCMVATTEVEDCYSIVDGNLYEAVYCRYTGMKTGQTCTASDKAEATKPPAPTSCPAGYSQGEINGTTTCVKCSTPDCSGGGTGGGGTDGGGTDGGTGGGGTDGGGTGGGGTGGGGTDGGGTDGGGDGTDGGGDGDGEEPADNPTPSGSLYTAKGKTLQSVMQAQQAAFSNTGLGRIATTFFTVPNTGASCPTWSAEIPYLSTTLTFDFFCLELVAKILLVVKGVLLVIASYAAFRVAFG